MFFEKVGIPQGTGQRMWAWGRAPWCGSLWEDLKARKSWDTVAEAGLGPPALSVP